MRVVGLVSGGKDSCYNMMQCVAAGHTIVALANIQPNGKDELDSYMYQTVGHQGISVIAAAMDLPLYRGTTKGNALEKGRMYQQTENDEVEDLFDLLQKVKNDIHIEGVAVGAILSDYQRVRVENVCSRLGLVSLAYLWRRDQTELLQEMIDCKVYAIVIKVAALGLEPSALGRPLRALQPQLQRAKDKFGLNVCGEGGEYETFTLDCPLYKSRIVVDETQIVVDSNDPIAPAGYMNLLKFHLEPKPDEVDGSAVVASTVKSSLDYISELNESSYSDLSDLELSESELENTEEISKARRQSMSESASLNPLLNNQSSNQVTSLSGTYSCPSVLIENTNLNRFPDDLTGRDSQKDESECDIKKLCLNNAGLGSRRNESFSLETELKNGAENNKRSRRRTISRNYMSNPPSPIKYENERDMIKDRSSIFSNRSGWHWIGGIVGEGSDSAAAMENAMLKLCNMLASHDLSLTNVCAVTLYVRNMGDYAALNKAYVKAMSFPDPPSRVCVECPLSEENGIILEALAHKWPSKGGGEETMFRDRHTMHVQGISHWAPANIGPYSQAVRVGDIINVAGQIPLVPGSMLLAPSDGRAQCRLALRHVQRLLSAMDSKTQMRDVVQAICYLTHPWLIEEARRQWERRTNNAIVDYVVVPALPREAPLEWHVWAHRHNSRFEYEETGCNIGDYKVAIRRRWNYENNVAAVVCHVATGSPPSTSQLFFQNEESSCQHKLLASQITTTDLISVLEYCCKKLLKDCQSQATVGLRLFYKVSIAPDVNVIIDALDQFRNDTLNNLAFTVIPAIHLQNAFTFLSISAMRHETE